jgi:hypothetical protein
MKCSQCGADTIMCDRGVPLCVACADEMDDKRKPQGQETRVLKQPQKEPARKIA